MSALRRGRAQSTGRVKSKRVELGGGGVGLSKSVDCAKVSCGFGQMLVPIGRLLCCLYEAT